MGHANTISATTTSRKRVPKLDRRRAALHWTSRWIWPQALVKPAVRCTEFSRYLRHELIATKNKSAVDWVLLVCSEQLQNKFDA
jgi:hypothetical protein